MLHIWRKYALLQQFWKEVHALTTRVITYTLDYSPAQYLLHHTTLPKKHYYKSLAMHMIIVARLCIPVHW